MPERDAVLLIAACSDGPEHLATRLQYDPAAFQTRWHDTRRIRRATWFGAWPKPLLSGFVEQVRKLREEKPDNLMAAIETLLSDFLEEGKQKLKG
jgi:hypothetical protein